MKEYVAKRSEVCLGNVIKPEHFYLEKSGELYFTGEKQRGILYTDFNNYANDIMWRGSMLYPVIDKFVSNEDKATLLRYKPFVIADYLELEEILKYLNFKEDLTKSDILHIYHLLITNSIFVHKANSKMLAKIVSSVDKENLSKAYNIGLIGNGKPTMLEKEIANFQRR